MSQTLYLILMSFLTIRKYIHTYVHTRACTLAHTHKFCLSHQLKPNIFLISELIFESGEVLRELSFWSMMRGLELAVSQVAFWGIWKLRDPPWPNWKHSAQHCFHHQFLHLDSNQWKHTFMYSIQPIIMFLERTPLLTCDLWRNDKRLWLRTSKVIPNNSYDIFSLNMCLRTHFG